MEEKKKKRRGRGRELFRPRGPSAAPHQERRHRGGRGRKGGGTRHILWLLPIFLSLRGRRKEKGTIKKKKKRGWQAKRRRCVRFPQPHCILHVRSPGREGKKRVPFWKRGSETATRAPSPCVRFPFFRALRKRRKKGRKRFLKKRRGEVEKFHCSPMPYPFHCSAACRGNGKNEEKGTSCEKKMGETSLISLPSKESVGEKGRNRGTAVIFTPFVPQAGREEST